MTLRHRLHRVIYVPLDDRPVNASRPHLLAQMVDYELITPPAVLLGRYRTPGRPEELADWLIAQVDGPHAADCLILSLDMLVYGGLIASRSFHLSLEEATARLGILAHLKKQAPGIPIYASSVILREAAGGSWIGDLDDYYQELREYSRLAAEAGRSDAENQYLAELAAAIPAAILRRYHQLRERNHQINLRATEELANERIDFLVLSQDDAGQAGLHKVEQTRLQDRIKELNVGDRAMICPGTDEVGMTLFARFVHWHMQKQPVIKVWWINPAASERIAPYEDRSISETVAAQVAMVGGRLAQQTEEANLILLVNPPKESDNEDREALIRKALADVAQVATTRGVAICDVATPNGADDELVNALLDSKLELVELLAFSGWNTAANSIGSALAHATLRLIARQDKGAFDLAHLFTRFAPMRYLQLLNSLINTERAHVQLLFLSLVDDWLYQTRLRPQLKEELHRMVNDGGTDLTELYPRAQQMLSNQLAEAAADLWMKHFWGKTCVQVGAGEERNNIVLAELEETHVQLPWRRLFEVAIEFDINLELVAAKEQL